MSTPVTSLLQASALSTGPPLALLVRTTTQIV